MRRRWAARIAMGVTLTGALWVPGGLAAEPAQGVEQKVDALTKEVEALKRDVKKTQDKSLGRWLELGGDYRFRVDSLRADVAGYSDGMEFFTNMAKDLVGRQTPAEITNFFMTTSALERTEKLFSYMPGAVATNISTAVPDFGGFSLLQALGGMDAGTVTAYLGQTALTGQQAAIMASLLTPQMFQGVMGSLSQADQALLGAIMQDPQKAKLFQQLVGQGMLGANGPYVKPRKEDTATNNLLYTNRVGLNLKAKATKDITFNMRLTMYKTFGSEDDDAVTGSYFADRVGVFDGTRGRVPSSSFLNVDRAYVTWSNIAEQPVWFSVGRRPSTGGSPTQVRLNGDPPGTGGVPGLLVDYAFDGATLGVAPDIGGLPGAFAKLCYGRGFESGVDKDDGPNLRDTDMMGVSIVPIDIDPLRIDLTWNRGTHIFDFPVMKDTVFGDTAPSADLGSIDWLGVGVLSHLKKSGFTWFTSAGMSFTHPNDNVSTNAGMQGLLTGQFFAPEEAEDKTGWAVYVGGRYDLKTGTSFGAEYNHGSENWITFAPAADDMWTAKLGTRGNVYEVYLIQDLNLAPVSSYFSKAFFRLGYQYYDFQYTGSNNWVGAPQKISDLNDTDLALLAPIEKAQNLYATFEVKF